MANSLTVFRFVLGVALPWSPGAWQFWMLLIAGITDLMDGWISRQLGATSGFGQFFDPIADKTLVLSAVVTALLAGWISWPELLGLAARDVTVLVLCGWALCQRWDHWQRLTPRLSGKIATGGQIAALLAVFWTRQPMPALVWTAATLSILSALDYSCRAVREARKSA